MLAAGHPVVRAMVLASLRHWAEEYALDGFVFANAENLVQVRVEEGLDRACTGVPHSLNLTEAGRGGRVRVDGLGHPLQRRPSPRQQGGVMCACGVRRRGRGESLLSERFCLQRRSRRRRTVAAASTRPRRTSLAACWTRRRSPRRFAPTPCSGAHRTGDQPLHKRRCHRPPHPAGQPLRRHVALLFPGVTWALPRPHTCPHTRAVSCVLCSALKLVAAPASQTLLPRAGVRGFPHWGRWMQVNDRFRPDLWTYLVDNAPGLLSRVATRIAGQLRRPAGALLLPARRHQASPLGAWCLETSS